MELLEKRCAEHLIMDSYKNIFQKLQVSDLEFKILSHVLILQLFLARSRNPPEKRSQLPS